MEMIMQSQSRVIDEMKLNAFLNERTIYINDNEIVEDTEFIINRMFEKIVERDNKAGIKPENAKPIILKISSYGGDVFASLSIISQIEYLRDLGYWIIGIGYGKIMSGAFKILIACSERWCQRHSRLLYHQVQSFEMGRTSVESDRRRLKDMEEMWCRCQDIILKYTKITQEQLDIITREDRDIYLWAEEALSLNIIDKIL
jgi:ATP-dependent protease ClpP protease subunit